MNLDNLVWRLEDKKSNIKKSNAQRQIIKIQNVNKSNAKETKNKKSKCQGFKVIKSQYVKKFKEKRKNANVQMQKVAPSKCQKDKKSN